MSCTSWFNTAYLGHIGLKLFVDAALDYASEDDRKIAREFSSYWMNIVKHAITSKGNFEVSCTQILPLQPSHHPF